MTAVFPGCFTRPHTRLLSGFVDRSATIDAIFVPVGGGGLIAGVAAYAKSLRPEILVIGVEPMGANAMAHSLAAGERVELAASTSCLV